jgi:serine/threonine-protein kinase RsbW
VGTDSTTVHQGIGADAPAVRLELDSRPETLTLVRGMLSGLAERVAMDAELLDDLKTAISEACNNVVLHAYPGGSGRLTVDLTLGLDRVEVIVRDQGCGITRAAASEERVLGVGIPVIRALADRAEFRPRAEGGTEVWMLFAGERDGKSLFDPPMDAGPEDGWSENLSGDAVVSVSPVALLGGVLGRLSRALAASARFSLDRFSDVYLVTDAISALAATAATGPRIGFAIRVQTRRLELLLGPLGRGSIDELRRRNDGRLSDSPLELLSDELAAETIGASELLHVVMIDHRRAPA